MTVPECRTLKSTLGHHSSPNSWPPSPLKCCFDTWKPLSISGRLHVPSYQGMVEKACLKCA